VGVEGLRGGRESSRTEWREMGRRDRTVSGYDESELVALSHRVPSILFISLGFVFRVPIILFISLGFVFRVPSILFISLGFSGMSR
jgi:hypothetical protein